MNVNARSYKRTGVFAYLVYSIVHHSKIQFKENGTCKQPNNYLNEFKTDAVDRLSFIYGLEDMLCNMLRPSNVLSWAGWRAEAIYRYLCGEQLEYKYENI